MYNHVVFLIRWNIEFTLFIYKGKEAKGGERGAGRKKEKRVLVQGKTGKRREINPKLLMHAA